MTENPKPAGVMQQSQRRGLLPPEIMELMVAPVKFGAWTGSVGAVAGVAVSIARDTNPLASGIATGFQWFALGGSFWFSRSVAARSMGGEEHMKPSEKTIASMIGGSATGAVAGLIRGPARILPSMILWGILGAGGQVAANTISKREIKVKDENDSWLSSKWSPLRKLSDEEYIDMMEDKIMKVEVDIALIDDRIAELRAGDQMSHNSKEEVNNNRLSR